MKSNVSRTLVVALVLLLLTVVVGAPAATAGPVMAPQNGKIELTNATSDWVVQILNGAGYYVASPIGEHLDVPAGATMSGYVNMGQVANFFAYNTKTGGEEIFLGGAQILPPCPDGPGGTLKVRAVQNGSVKLEWSVIPLCWNHLANANLAPAPAPTAVTQSLTQAQFTALFTAMPQDKFDNKVSTVKAATFASKVRASLPITATLVIK